MSSKKISLLPLYSGDPAGTYLVMNNAGETGSFKVLRETIIGASGSAGTSGTSGSAGTSGLSGSAGTSGTSGISGSSGTSGTSGASGSAGTSGIDGTANFTASASVPTSPNSGDRWYDLTSGNEFIYVNDGNSSQWVTPVVVTAGSSGVNGSSGTSGISGSAGTSGTSGTSGISGYVDNDWLYFKPTTATIPSTGNNFVLSGTVTSNGSVSYNDTNGIITLAANKTYKLSASFALANSINNAEVQYHWINVTASNTLIGNTGAVIVVNSSASAAWQPSAEAIIVTTGTTQVALRSTFANSTGDFATSQCFMMVNQINGWSGSSGTSGSAGTSGISGSAGTSGTSSNAKTTGSWTLATGANTVSFTVTAGESYVMWVNGNIPNGIVNWNATVTLSNSNVPVIGVQYGWNYVAGGALLLTSIPSQIIGTAGTISTSAPAVSNSNTFTFGITNSSGTSQTVYYGYTQI